MPQYRRKLSGLRKTKGGKGIIGELRWTSEDVQHRILGFYGDGVWYALVGCTHKQGVYSPADALETAVKRKHQIQNGEVTTVEYDL
jgi:hypothetical protein